MGLFELIYYIGLSVSKRSGLKRRRRLPARVLSIGNLTLGGTGKTPVTMAVAQEALGRGLKPCILTRGYRGRARGPVFVSMGEGPLLNVFEAGDEPVLMAEKLKGVPVVKCADRYEGGMFALNGLPCAPDFFLLDDGFQHWRVHRDKDVVLVNSVDPFNDMRLLPVGTLREPLSSLKRADIVVITNTREGRSYSDIEEEIRKHNGSAGIFHEKRVISTLRDIKGGDMSPSDVQGRDVFAFCAIGEPESFKATIYSLNPAMKGFRSFRDHHMYSQADIDRLASEARASGAAWILTTEKDIIKLKGLGLPDNLFALCVDSVMDAGFYDAMLT